MRAGARCGYPGRATTPLQAGSRTRWLAAAVGVLLAAGCGGGSTATYQESAAAVLEASLSDARTAELAGRLWLAGRSSHATASVVVAGSEEGLGSEAAWFERQEPPGPVGDELRAEVTEVLDAAADAVQQVRIAVARSDREASGPALEELRGASAAVESLAEELG